MEELEQLKRQLLELNSRKTELATMCRIAEVSEIKAHIASIKNRIDQQNDNADSRSMNKEG